MNRQTGFSGAELMATTAAIIATLALTTGCPMSRDEKVQPRLNRPPIIVIVIDTLRADYLGAFGFDGPVSPHIDALARESVLFRRCSSQAPWTTPSMASMMTSLYPEAHGVRLAPDDPRDQANWRRRWTRAIPESTTTLAETLREHGYRTAAFVANPFMTHGLGFEQGFDVFDERAAATGDRDGVRPLGWGLQWLRSVRHTGDPTFLYLHLMDVHPPYLAPEPDFQAVRASPGLGAEVTIPDWGIDRIQPYLRSPLWARRPDSNRLRVWRGRYAAGVHAADRRIGDFIASLEDEGLWQEQLVVLTSDHGEELFDHGGWDHGFSLHEHQLHVPLILRFPHGEHAGKRIGHLVRLIDVMPTLLDLAGITGPAEMLGRNIAALATTQADSGPTIDSFATSVKDSPGFASICDGRHKLIADAATPSAQLFDLDVDPGERHDLAAAEPAIVAALLARLVSEIARISPGEESSGTTGAIPQEQLDRLQELGYLR